MELPAVHARSRRRPLHRRRPLLPDHRAEKAGCHPRGDPGGAADQRRGRRTRGARMRQDAAGGRAASSAVTVLGLTFKENVPDIRNSRVVDIIAELKSFGVAVEVHDPLADAGEAATNMVSAHADRGAEPGRRGDPGRAARRLPGRRLAVDREPACRGRRGPDGREGSARPRLSPARHQALAPLRARISAGRPCRFDGALLRPGEQ